MLKKGLVIGIIVMFIGFSISSNANNLVKKSSITCIRGNILYVGGNGPGNYSTIQEAINYANDGDTVFVYDDSSPYYENVIMDKSINLIGEDRNTTIIDGNYNGDVIFISNNTNWVNISRFTIRKSGNGDSDSGIEVQSNNNTIEQNILTNNRFGIFFRYANIDNNKVSNNIIKSNSVYGVYARPYPTSSYRCKNLTIIGNEITNNGNAGIWIVSCTYSNISYNVLSYNGEGLDMQWHSNNSLISNNIIDNNNFYGFWLVYTYNCTVRNNFLGAAGFETLCINQHEDYLEPCNHSIYHNYITDMEWDDSISRWDNGWISGGNYRGTGTDNYRGENQDRPGPDGLRDTPHHIPGGSRWDYYPLVFEWGDHPPVAEFLYTVDERTVSFNGSYSYDRDGEIIQYYWDFGDGTNGTGMMVDHTYPENGNETYNVTLKVKDNDGKYGNYSRTTWVIEDTTPPEIIDCTPATGYTGDKFSFNAIITDQCGIYLVCVEYWYGSGAHTNVTMKKNIGSDFWQKTIKVEHTLDELHYIISANDIFFNWNNTGIKDVTIVDNDLPVISEIEVYPPQPHKNEYVNISALVTDNIEVEEVYLNIEYPDGSSEEFSIKQNKTLNDRYYCNRTYQMLGPYTFYIWANDTSNNIETSLLYYFTILNQPPNIPSDPEPEDGATDVDINADLFWDCSDPDGDNLAYDVYFEANDSTPDILVSDDQNETWYDPGTMKNETHYYWKIVASDEYDSTAGPIWDFITMSEPNNPPYPPGDPYPENNSIDVDVDADLSWTGGDPDEGDTVVYDVFLNGMKVADDISDTTFDPGTLEYETMYQWCVFARDNHGATTWGTMWHFTTETAPEPDLECEGSLSWTKVKPGDTVIGSFTIINIGSEGAKLDWEIVDWPKDWGMWTFTLLSGDDLTPEDGPVTINVSVVAPDEKNSKLTGEIKVFNIENSSDFCTIDVSLTTPKNKPFGFIYNLLNWLDRFPLLQRLLEWLLG